MKTATTRIYEADSQVLDYIDACKKLGFKNNSSLDAMKWQWCLDTGAWYATRKQDTIISITGVHVFKDGYRALFRGAQIETRPVAGLNRYQMQSYGIYDHLPLQIDFAHGVPIYITTNITNDASGKMNRIHKSFRVMEQGGMVTYMGDEEIFYTLQRIWRLNVDRYFEIRKRYED